MPQVRHGTFMELLGVKTPSSTHLLLSHRAALIQEIRMTFHLSMSRSLPQHVMGMVLRPCQKFSCSSLPPLQHAA